MKDLITQLYTIQRETFIQPSDCWPEHQIEEDDIYSGDKRYYTTPDCEQRKILSRLVVLDAS